MLASIPSGTDQKVVKEFNFSKNIPNLNLKSLHPASI